MTKNKFNRVRKVSKKSLCMRLVTIIDKERIINKKHKKTPSLDREIFLRYSKLSVFFDLVMRIKLI